MVSIILAAATGLSAPSPANSFSNNDYPAWALARDASVAAVISLVVDPQGKAVQCINLREIGDPRLAKEVCRILSRKRVQPPTLRDGQKVHAFLETMIRLFLPDTDKGRQIMVLHSPPDAELSVNQLPNGESAEVGIILAYDSAGKITDCAPSETEKQVALANVACSQKVMFDNAIKNDISGQSVAYVTRKRVLFAVSPQVK